MAVESPAESLASAAGAFFATCVAKIGRLTYHDVS